MFSAYVNNYSKSGFIYFQLFSPKLTQEVLTEGNILTRMHSSRMRTARSSSRREGVSTSPPPGPCTPLGQPPRGQTHACKHITLPQTSFAGGNNIPNRVSHRMRENTQNNIFFPAMHLTSNTF